VDAQPTPAEDITEVEIFGAVYRVRGRDDEGHLQDVAALVDNKMREVADHARTADTAKIAILAALNLADELLKNRTRQQGERVEIKERVTALTGELAEALVR
jgi:cell division protein ZapA